MSREVTPRSFGQDVVGPVVAEFCLRLWSTAAQFERPDDARLLFCARGGLRMQMAYEAFLAATGLRSPVAVEPLMVSRLVAVRPALLRTVVDDLDDLVPAAARAFRLEFPHADLAEVARTVSGTTPPPDPRWREPYSSRGLAALLRDPDGAPAVAALRVQADLFDRHLRHRSGGAHHAVLVDTGLYGTTRDLLAPAFPDLDVSCALIARSFKPGSGHQARTYGLSAQAHEYTVFERRSSLLRYWHYVEWIFEPELPSVTTFHDEDGVPRSDLEVAGWQDRVAGDPDSAFGGVLEHLRALPRGGAGRVVADADHAWSRLRRAVVLPRPQDGRALVISGRTLGFGRDGTWTTPEPRSTLEVLRSDGMWREGEIARSGTALRLPVLAAVEAAYAARGVLRRVMRRTGRG